KLHSTIGNELNLYYKIATNYSTKTNFPKVLLSSYMHLHMFVELKVENVDVKKLLSPLPRAYEWIDGSAYINHIVLVRKARGAEPPKTLKTDPLVYQGGSGTFLAPTQDIAHYSEDFGIDFESEICVIVDDVPMGTSKKKAEQHIKLFMLANDVTLRNLIPNELAKGFGFFVSKPSTAF